MQYAWLWSGKRQAGLRRPITRRNLRTSLVAAVVALAVLVWQWIAAPVEHLDRSDGMAVSTKSAASGGERYRLHGLITDVTDGDTLQIQVTGAGQQWSGQQRVRLASVDAPERTTSSQRPGQPFGNAARRFLSERVQGRTLTLSCFEQDLYERHICDVPDPGAEGVTVNQRLVAEGMAWANMEGQGRFLRDESLIGLQDHAKKHKRGLWSEPKPVPPWVWRYQCWRNGMCG